MTPQGERFDQGMAKGMAKEKHLIFICGHYEGIDERVIKKEVTEEISIGDFVLTNGCLAAIVLIDATIRFLDGSLGNKDAAFKDSYSEGILEGPQYTRPVDFEGEKVPEVLLSGNHLEIEKYRYNMGLEKTKRIRPDLYKRRVFCEKENS